MRTPVFRVPVPRLFPKRPIQPDELLHARQVLRGQTQPDRRLPTEHEAILGGRR